MAAKLAKMIVSVVLVAAMTSGMVYVGTHMDFFGADAYSDTFAGYVSETSYSTKEDTAKAFLQNELTGATAKPIYTGYTILEKITSKEVEELGITNLTDKVIRDAEKVKIDYICNDAETSAKTYILNSTQGYLYFIPPQETGEALTNAYFNIVCDGNKYLNSTATTNINLRVISSQMTTESTYRQIIYFDDDKAFFNQELPGFDTDIYFEERNNSILIYIEDPNNKNGHFYTLDELGRKHGVKYYVYLVKGSESVNVDTLNKMKDIVDFAFMLELDASYFVKTDVGFSMTDDKYKEVCKFMAGEAFAEEIEKNWEEHHIHFRADYYVTDGRLSASRIVLTMSDGEDIFALTLETRYTDFGSTEVVLPN